MRIYLPIAAAAFIVLLLAGACKGESPAAVPAAAPTQAPVTTFASTLEGEALVQHDRLMLL